MEEATATEFSSPGLGTSFKCSASWEESTASMDWFSSPGLGTSFKFARDADNPTSQVDGFRPLVWGLLFNDC